MSGVNGFESKRSIRRWNNYNKAKRKMKISEQVHSIISGIGGVPFSYYRHFNQYSKGKIHCSCWMCSNKVNRRGKSPNWGSADRKRIDAMEEELLEFDIGLFDFH